MLTMDEEEALNPKEHREEARGERLRKMQSASERQLVIPAGAGCQPGGGNRGKARKEKSIP